MPYLLAWLLACSTLLPAAGRIEDQLARPELKNLEVSFGVMDVASGRWLFSRDIDRPLAPASNMKVLTTATALALLGPDYRFTTRFLATGPIDGDGILHGDLVVVGGGDPCLRAEILSVQGMADPAGALADLLARAGVSAVTGGMILDDGLFDTQGTHPDWEASDLALPYAAPVGALSVNGNCLTLAIDGRGNGVRPSVSLLTEAIDYRLDSTLRRADASRTYKVGRARPDDAARVRVWGTVGGGVGRMEERVAVRDATAYFGRCLMAELQRRSIRVAGGWRVRPGASVALTDPVELLRFETPLALALLLANKESDNSVADHLWKLVGARAGGEGSFQSGARAVEDFLRDTVGTSVERLRLRDGSGLSPANRVTTRAIVQTLAWMARSDAHRDVYLRTLPVSGRDGSLHARLTERPYLQSVRAKTGWITGTSALSGYVQARSGKTLAFSILFNRVRPGTNKVMKAVQDELCRSAIDRW